jgi:hypothetical protein
MDRNTIIEECAKALESLDTETRLDDPDVAADCIKDAAIKAVRALKTLPDTSHGFHIFKDGSAWCAVGPHFRDLMQDRAGFGDAPEDAFEAWWQANENSPNIRAVVQTKPAFSDFTVHQ